MGQELFDVVSFSATLGERGAGKKSIAARTVLTCQVPTRKRTNRCRQVRFPHHGLRSEGKDSFRRMFASGISARPTGPGDGRQDNEDRTDGRRPGRTRAPSIPTAAA
jgi:hypothetical protein